MATAAKATDLPPIRYLIACCAIYEGVGRGGRQCMIDKGLWPGMALLAINCYTRCYWEGETLLPVISAFARYLNDGIIGHLLCALTVMPRVVLVTRYLRVPSAGISC